MPNADALSTPATESTRTAVERDDDRDGPLNATAAPAAEHAPIHDDRDGPPICLDPSTALPHDPTITVGSLDNGLRYYIRPNARPKRRLELRVAVRAGSILEDESERGLAHFTEHLAFRHSSSHKNHALIRHLEAMGMKFGAHQNAYTTFHETVYSLHVPTNDAYEGTDGDSGELRIAPLRPDVLIGGNGS